MNSQTEVKTSVESNSLARWTRSTGLRNIAGFPFFRAALLSLTALIAMLLLAEAIHFIPVHGENLTAESSTPLLAQQWANGQPLYGDFRKPPYFITPFPPGLYAILAVAYKAGITSLDGLMLFGRLLSLLSVMGIGCIAYLFNRAGGLRLSVAIVTPLLFFSFPVLLPWAVTVRNDFPALFLAILAVYIAHLRPASRKMVALAALIAAAAFLTKHSMIAVPTALVLWMFFSGRRKDSFLFTAIWFTTVGTVFMYFQLQNPGMLQLNIFGSKIYGERSLQNAHESFVDVMLSRGHEVTIVLAALAISGVLLAKRTDPGRRGRFLTVYLLLTLLLALLTSMFSNAAVNHYIEPALAASMLAAIAFEQLGESWPSLSAVALPFVVITALLLFASVDVQRWNFSNDKPDTVARLTPVITNRMLLSDVPFLAARSSRPEFVETISLRFSEKAGIWSPEPVEKDIQKKTFDLIALHWSLEDPRWNKHRYSRLGPLLRSAIAQNYSFCTAANDVYFYTPRVDSEKAVLSCPALRAQLANLN